MNRFFLLSAVALGITVIAFAQPKLEIVGGETYDWGKVVVKNNPLKLVTLETEVTLKNTGNKTLIIDTVKVGCGCTTPYLESKVIEPGKSTKLRIGLNAGLNSGEMIKNLTIFSNADPENTGRIMYLKANVFRPITVQPSACNFPEIKVGEVARSSVTLKNNDTRPYTLTMLFPTKGIKIDKQAPITLNPGDTLQINATFEGKERGYYNGNIIVQIDDPEYVPFEIAAYGNVKGLDGSDDPSVIKIQPVSASPKKESAAAPAAEPPRRKK
ncbi:MAG: DUF1573 domain-containing protein [Bacteroidota bacterium]|nr:DUF1573 domain-containing protein [Candidatus Kapabacteria bacterium]MCS7303040.1 DUF1573 domain-containing protein [Candidatus Kapabacteria bacterium]MCX7937716.1 DUF1573 domain-containing protein [Chlorobiota bacterium]MDW8075357.1 DUF1573 domain-containing protein [Bacteroidota bacterium]MDW8272142.1 DUF1573 domain-containing protein [Bacteroidota bacterium]